MMPAFYFCSRSQLWKKECTVCQTVYESEFCNFDSDFQFVNGRGDGYQAMCRPCDTHRDTKMRHRNNRVERLEAQDGKCGICNTPIEFGKNANCDHHHETKYNRGVLCNSCNTGMGYVDNLEWVAKAIEYWDKWRRKYDEDNPNR